MFIKIKNNPNYSKSAESFTIIDNVATVNFFQPTAKRITVVEELNAYLEMDWEGVCFDYTTIRQIQKGEIELSQKNPYLINQLSFTLKDGDEQGEDWAFDTVAYLMSDEGKTIEKAQGGGLLSKAINNIINNG